MGTAGDREHSTEDQGVRESKQNKASRPILTFAPLPQQRAAPPSFPTEEEKTLQLDPSSLLPRLNRAGGSSSPYLCPALGWTDGLGLFTAASSRHNSNTDSARSRLLRLCSMCTQAGENVT